jgi:hypothetical protein
LARWARSSESVTFQYDEDFDHARVVAIADNARETFEGMPGLRSKAFTIDDERRRAMNFLAAR